MAKDGNYNFDSILGKFAIYGELEEIELFGSGHINQTYRSLWNQAGKRIHYTHQKINEKVFLKPDELMENIDRVTRHIAAKLKNDRLEDRSRRVLKVVLSNEGKPYVRDDEGGWWRTFLFIENTHTLEVTDSQASAGFLGRSIAIFQRQLVDLGGKRLYETIPDFHNMEKRYERFHDALLMDCKGRAKDARPEIDFMKRNEGRGAALIRSLREGRLPERICHNDTKMGNILIDNDSSEALCVIDLDTVMPGTCLFDVGDLIRTVTTTAAEDETDLSKVEFDLEFFEALLGGYLSEAGKFLTTPELELICESGRNITQIMGLRFLTDYLEGDRYYRIARPDHNLDRCRTQIALINSMDAKWEKAEKIVKSLV